MEVEVTRTVATSQVTPRNVRRKTQLRLFVDAYLANGGNAMAALEAVGTTQGKPGALRVRAHRMLAQARALGMLEERIERVTRRMGADEVIERLSDMARASVTDFITLLNPEDEKTLKDADVGEGQAPAKRRILDDRFYVDIPRAIREGKGHLVREIGYDRNTGLPEVKLHDAKGALDSLARIYGIDRSAQRDNDHTQVRVLVLQMLTSDPQARRMVDDLAKRALDVKAEPA